MKPIVNSLFQIANRFTISIASIVMIITWLTLALINYVIFLASSSAIILCIFLGVINGNWFGNLTYLYGIGINTETWKIVSIHGWFYIFAFSSFMMRYFSMIGIGTKSKAFFKLKYRQASETKYVFVSPPEIG